MENIDINGWITIIAIAVYLIVFFIQKSQINKQEKLIKGMETYVNSINIQKINDYATLLDKRAELRVDEFKNNYDKNIMNEKIIPLVTKGSEKVKEELFEYMFPKLRETQEFITYFFVFNTNATKEEKLNFTKKHFKENEKFFNNVIEIYHENKSL